MYKAQTTLFSQETVICLQGCPAGRMFLYRLIDLSCTVLHMHHHLWLCIDAYLDLDWWLAFLSTWNRTVCILSINWSTSSSMSLFTDAPGTLGWGHIGLKTGSKPNGLLTKSTRTLLGKSCSQMLTPGATSGQGKRYMCIVTIAVVDIWKKETTCCPELMTLVCMLLLLLCSTIF